MPHILYRWVTENRFFDTACQLTFSWSLHLQLSAGQPQTIQADDSLLSPGVGRPVWGGSSLGQGCWWTCWFKVSAPDTGPSRSCWVIPAVTAGFRRLKRHLQSCYKWNVILNFDHQECLQWLWSDTCGMALSGLKSSILSRVLMSRFPMAICKPLSSPRLLDSKSSKTKFYANDRGECTISNF